MSLNDFAADLLKLYNEMSESFSQYQNSTGITCPSNCGKCCDNPEIEASPMEMIPMALELLRRGELDLWLEKLEDAPGTCAIFNAITPDKELGRCSIYEYRPPLCRMFGVSGWTDKNDKVGLSICKKLKVLHPERVLTTSPNEETPILRNWSMKLMQYDSRLVSDRMPINLALKRALEKVALYSMYHTNASE